MRRLVRAGLVIVLFTAGMCPLAAQEESSSEDLNAPERREADSIAFAEHMRATQPEIQAPAWHAMITNLPGDWAKSASLVVQPKGLQTLAGLGVLTGVLMVADGSSYHWTQTACQHNGWMLSGVSSFESLGNGRNHLGVAAAFAIGGVVAGDARSLRTGSQIVEGLLATGVVVQLLKHVSGRESPAHASAAGGVWRFFPNLRSYQKDQTRYYSFPSGHIATAMTTVTIIAGNYPDLPWIRPVGYAAVGLVGVSLVGVKYHWYSDLPLGIAIGHLIGSVITGRNVPEDAAAGKTDEGPLLTWEPRIGRSGAGLNVALNF